MADDAAAILVTAEFGETTTYTENGGSPRSVIAVIRRRPIEGQPQDRDRTPQRRADYYVRRHATAGVLTPTRGLDLVSFPEEVGGTAVDWRVLEILGRDDCAVWHLEVGR